MLGTAKKIIYKAFGFRVLSDIELPELQSINDGDDSVDITIEFGELAELWNEVANPKSFYYVNNDLIMYRIPHNAIYSIKDGDKITVTPLEGFEEDSFRLYLLGSCMGAILMQRKILPLHGSAIAINGKAYAIVGNSGAGKSTLASALLSKGYQLISDDVIPVTITDGIPMVTPAYPQQKLWLESLNYFGIESDGLRPIIDRETKFAIPVDSQFASEPFPLAGVFELVKTENEGVEILPISNLQRLHTLFYHTYRNFLIGPMGLMEWHFNLTASFANKIELFQLRRPTNQFTAQELSSMILATINQEATSLAK